MRCDAIRKTTSIEKYKTKRYTMRTTGGKHTVHTHRCSVTAWRSLLPQNSNLELNSPLVN